VPIGLDSWHTAHKFPTLRQEVAILLDFSRKAKERERDFFFGGVKYNCQASGGLFRLGRWRQGCIPACAS
jgi:hypothetical protein